MIRRRLLNSVRFMVARESLLALSWVWLCMWELMHQPWWLFGEYHTEWVG